MHQEHARWRADNNLWRDDLAAWQKEVHDAIDQLPELEKAIERHAQLLQTHAASVRLYEQDAASHEHLLAEYERGESPEALIKLAQAHQEAAHQHAKQCESHEGLKNQQHRLMTKWRQLFTALSHVKAKAVSASAK
jgi:hypothetical protein